MGRRPLEICQFFQCGDGLYTLASDVYGRQILTYKDDPLAETVNHCGTLKTTIGIMVFFSFILLKPGNNYWPVWFQEHFWRPFYIYVVLIWLLIICISCLISLSNWFCFSYLMSNCTKLYQESRTSRHTTHPPDNHDVICQYNICKKHYTRTASNNTSRGESLFF